VGFIFSFAAFRYEDFFGGKNEKGSKTKDQLLEVSGDEDDMESDKQVTLSLRACLCLYIWLWVIFFLNYIFIFYVYMIAIVFFNYIFIFYFLLMYVEEKDCFYLWKAAGKNSIKDRGDGES